MSTTVETPARTGDDIVTTWLEQFGVALGQHDHAAAAALFTPGAWWRDLLAFTWDLRTLHGRDAMVAMLAERLAPTAPTGFRLAEGTEPVVTDDLVEGFVEFETAVARCRGYLRLVRTGDGHPRAQTLLTAMEELIGGEPAAGPRRPKGTTHGEHRGTANWLDERAARREYLDRDPSVLIVGAGQGGLALGARLGRLGVDTLLVERNTRVGDNWRNRYHSLVLHDPVWYDHLPYLPFPDHWPVFTPKDKLANWFEFYADAMELDVWTGAEFLGGTHDEDEGRWTVRVRRPDGTERTLRPAHVVLATGMSGVPYIPRFRGTEDFSGTLVHSSRHTGGAAYAGAKALVVGSGNSAHDIAQEFHEHGAEVTLLQRSSTYVMSSENGIPTLFAGLYEEGGPPTADADLIFASIPYPMLGELHRGATQQIAELDAELLAGLESRGFALDYGEDGTGLFLKYLRRGGGYYIDVGCSELIAAGKVAVKQGVEIERFTSDGVEFSDGTSVEADIAVLATGYQNMRESARALFGDAVADRCTPVWGLDEEGELRTMWRRSGHPGFWFMGGNLNQARHYSMFLALQIKAIEAGLLPR
jgi:putative flavoprotein involved in K+ transport